MAKKDGPIKLPKKIAGVKIPKSVRNGALRDFLRSDVGRAMIAEAATQAVVLMVRRQSDADGQLTPARLADALSAAGRAFADTLEGAPAESPDADWPADFVAPAIEGQVRPH